jgi:hypothetical protein
VDYRAGEDPSIRIVQAADTGPGFVVEATPQTVRLGNSADPGEVVDLGDRSARALANAIGWFLADTDWETACQIVSRISGPHAPISVALAIGGQHVIVSAVSPVGRPWLISFPRATAAMLRDSLRAVSQVSWETMAAGGPTVTVTHPGGAHG